MTVLAGEWKQNDIGWWYSENDGSYPVSQWKWIDGNNDGNEECYYFDANGYMAANTVIEGFSVNENGAWTVNDNIQYRQVSGQTIKSEELYDEPFQDVFETDAISAAKEALCEAGSDSFNGDNFPQRKKALINYLQALGYNTDGLTVDEDGVSYRSFMEGKHSLYYMLVDNNDEIFHLMNYYVHAYYTWVKDDEGNFSEIRPLVAGLDDEGGDAYATNLINAVEAYICQ